MQVKNVIKLSAEMLNLEQTIQYLAGAETLDGQTNKSDADILLRCFNLVVNEIAAEYRVFSKLKNIDTQNGVIEYPQIDNQIISVNAVYKDGKTVRYKSMPNFISTSPGGVSVEYSYMPENCEIEDNIDLSGTKIPERIIAYGVCAEYSIISGAYDEGLMWDKRFKDSLFSSLKKTKKLSVPLRRWI